MNNVPPEWGLLRRGRIAAQTTYFGFSQTPTTLAMIRFPSHRKSSPHQDCSNANNVTCALAEQELLVTKKISTAAQTTVRWMLSGPNYSRGNFDPTAKVPHATPGVQHANNVTSAPEQELLVTKNISTTVQTTYVGHTRAATFAK